MCEILLIDNDPTVQITLFKMLEAQGYHVVVVDDGEQGILQAQQLRPGLIICDWMTPNLNGLEICRRIKADENLATTYFILLTTLGGVAECVQALEAGADDFITKPIEQNELKARVRAGLRLHQMSRDLQTQKHLLEAEFAEAADYVRSLLPPPMTAPLTINSCFIPSQGLGGDCFDYFWLDPDYLAIYLIDTAGHGLGATLPSVSVLNMLRSRALDSVNYYQPSDVLRALNNTFQITQQNCKYFTIWYGVYNRVNRQLIYSSGGHPPVILLSESATTKSKLLQTTGIPVGILPDATFTDSFCNLPEASTLYIFSDGAYEIKLSDGTIWELDAFISVLKDCHIRNYDLNQIVEHITNLNQKHTFDDDLSILQIFIN